MPNHRKTNSPQSALNRGELYAAYVEFMADATRAALPLEPNDYAREEFIRIHRPHSREEFDRCLDELTAQPDRLKKFCQLISDGFSAKKVFRQADEAMGDRRRAA